MKIELIEQQTALGPQYAVRMSKWYGYYYVNLTHNYLRWQSDREWFFYECWTLDLDAATRAFNGARDGESVLEKHP